MKLFKHIVHKEGESYEDDITFVYGKNTKSTYEIIRDKNGVAQDHDNVPDGCYLMINFPFNKVRKYTDTKTFEIAIGKCKPSLLFRIRKIKGAKFYSFNTYFVWRTPDIIDVRYDDPYLAALRINNKIKGKI